MASKFSFGGVTLSAPGVVTVVRDEGLTPVPVDVIQTVAIVGVGEGGEPKKVEWFSTPADMAARVRGGDLYDAVPFVWSPMSPLDRVGPQRVAVVRVNPAVRASTTLKNSATDIITVQAANWGLRDNSIYLKIETGTAANSKKVTVSDGVNTYVKDSIKRPLFTLTYTGSTLAVTVNATQVATTVTGGSGANQTALFATYNTLKKLVDFFAVQTGYTCVIDPTADPNMATADALDYLSAVSGLSQVLYANNMAIVDYLNSGTQPLVVASKIASQGLLVDNVTTPKYLTSGAEGSTGDSDWQSALNALIQEDVGFVVPLSSNATHHGYLATHCATVSADGKRPRRGVAGTAIGQLADDLGAAEASALNSSLVMLASQGAYIRRPDNTRVLLPPYFTAALLAGLQAGVSLGEAVTYKAVNLQELEWLPTDTQRHTAVDAGVVVIEKVPGLPIFRVVRGITTWRGNDKYNLVENSVGMVVDYVRRRSAIVAESFLGQPVNPQLAHRMLSSLETEFTTMANQGMLVRYEGGKPWANNSATVRGDAITISFSVQPVIPLNFVGIEINAQTLTSTVSVTTS